ncbi:MAG: septum formation initiator family protein [Pseudomonadota bacterium]
MRDVVRTGRALRASTVCLLVAGAFFAWTMTQLLLSPDGLRKTRELRAAVATTRVEIASLERRHASLAAEVNNLKRGLEAAEERARADLGMIGINESFYQIIVTDAE